MLAPSVTHHENPRQAARIGRAELRLACPEGAWRGEAGDALPRATWYQATRHTFASQWVMGNGSIQKLATVFGHCAAEVTNDCAHLHPDAFAGPPLDLARGPAGVVPLPEGPGLVHERPTVEAAEAGIG